MLRNRRIGGLTALVGACSLAALAFGQQKQLATYEAEEISPSGDVSTLIFPPGSGGGIAGAICTQPGGNCQLPDQIAARNSTGAYTAGVNYAGLRCADNFAVTTAGNITSVCFWGVYGIGGGNPCDPTPPTDNFTIKIYNNASGRPSTVAGTYVQGTNLTITGRDPAGALGALTEYEYTATLSGTLVNAATANCYWIEITNNLTGCAWFWESGTSTGVYPTAVQDLDGGASAVYSAIDVIQVDFAFCVNSPLANPITSGPCAVAASATTNECATAPAVLANNTPTSIEMRGNTNNATDPAMCALEVPGDNGTSVASTWVKFTAVSSSQQVQTCSDTGTDTILAVYSGTCGALTQLACNDDNCDFLSQMCVEGLTIGSTYFVQVRAFSDADRGVYVLTVGPCLDCQNHAPAGGYLLGNSTTGDFEVYDDFRVAEAGTLSTLTSRVTWWNFVNGAGSRGDRPATDSLTLRVFEQNPVTLLPQATPLATRSTATADLTVQSITSTNTYFNFNGTGAFDPGFDGELVDYALTMTPITGFQANTCYWYVLTSDILSPNGAVFTRLGAVEAVMTQGNNRSGGDGDNDGLENAELISADWISCMDLALGDPDLCRDFTPPANDEICGAQAVACNASGVTVTANLLNATENGGDPVITCSGTAPIGSVWYSITTGSVNPSFIIEDCATGQVGIHDSVIGVYTSSDGTCNGTLTEVACANDNCAAGAFEKVRVDPALPNTTYFVQFGSIDDFGQLFYDVTFTCPARARPANDACANAVALTIGVPVTGTTLDSSVDANISANTCNLITPDQPGIWYTVTNTSADTTLEASLCSVGTTAQDTVMTIWCGDDCASLQCVTGNDDGCGPASLDSSVQWCAKQNAKYWIHVSKFAGSTEGAIEIVINNIGGTCTPDPAGCPVAPSCPGTRGDTNCSGGPPDFFDIDPFLLALFDQPTYLTTFCGGSLCAADVDCSGGVDFFDIDPFLNCLFNACLPLPPLCAP